MSQRMETDTSDEEKNFFVGYTLGGGVETLLFQQVGLRVEYLYSGYGKENFSLEGTRVRTDFDSHTVRFGVGWYFCRTFDWCGGDDAP